MKINRITKLGLVLGSAAVLAAGCGKAETGAEAESRDIQTTQTPETEAQDTQAVQPGTSGEAAAAVYEGAVSIVLSDDQITVDGETAGTDAGAAVYTAHDIVYYEAGKDFTYGEGTEADEHTAEEADAHTVVHITEPGTYVVSGKLSAGQIAVDLGEDAEEDPEAVVTLVLDNADITCTVAPAMIFYEVYECGDTDEENAAMDVDTSAAGANVIIADGSVNQINGSYVARIYKSYELNEAGTEVVSNKKLHKYDGAFYSKMSMNVDGGEEGTGVLNITAENEGLDSELHLTINGGIINITSGNDGINTNEDGISVTTINGGTLTINVEGSTGEGDGIDSNGWLVINGGTVNAWSCGSSADSGLDSDMGIVINGGTVIAAGNMLDAISEDGQKYLAMNFDGRQVGGSTYTIKDESGDVMIEFTPANDFSCLVFSSPELEEGSYTVWLGETEISWNEGNGGRGGRGGMGKGGMRPDGADAAGKPDGDGRFERPQDAEKPDGTGRGKDGVAGRPGSDGDGGLETSAGAEQGGQP